MHRDLLNGILTDYSDDEEKYDRYVSLCINNAAQQGVDLSLEAATEMARNQFKTNSHQNNRLKATQALFDSKNGIFKPALDPISLADYHSEIKDYPVFESDTVLKTAESLIDKRSQSLIIIRNTRAPHSGSFYGEVLYFKRKVLKDKFQFGNSHPLYKNCGKILDEKEILQLKTHALDFYYYSDLLKNYLKNFMVSLAEKPNNPKILRYLIQLIGGKGIDILTIIHECLNIAINNQRLANVSGILKEYKEQAKGFVFNFSDLSTSNENDSLVEELSILTANRDSIIKKMVDGEVHGKLERNLENILKQISEIEHTLKKHKEKKSDSLIKLINQKWTSLQTHSPLVDILFLFHKYGNVFLKNQLDDYFNAITDHKNEKNYQKIIKKRQIVALISLQMFSKEYKFFANQLLPPIQVFYNQFVDLLRNSLIMSDEKLMIQFYKKNSEMFRHADVDKIKSVIIPDIFRKPENLQAILEIFSIFKACNLSKHFSYLRGGDINSMKDGLFALSQKKSSNFIFPDLITQTASITTNIRLPMSIALIIVEYTAISLFQIASPKIQKLRNQSMNDLETKELISYNLPIPQQASGSAECGYWSLFNLFLGLSQLSEFACLKFNYPEFKKQVSGFLNNAGKDLTAVDLEEIISQVVTKKDNPFITSFPNLFETFKIVRDEAGGIPPYTIINSELVDESKLDHSYSFGGCLPLLKMQVAINFYMLSQRSMEEPTFHFLIIGTRGHWHVQLLALAYQIKIQLFRMDSNAQMTTPVVIRRINQYILDILKNPERYGENIAAEVIPNINKTLDLLNKTLSSGLPLSKPEKQAAYANCEMAAQFFSTFSKLSWAKKFFPTLRLARKVAHGLQKDSPVFANLTQQLSYLQGLYSEDKIMNPSLFGSSIDTAPHQIRPLTHALMK